MELLRGLIPSLRNDHFDGIFRKFVFVVLHIDQLLRVAAVCFCAYVFQLAFNDHSATGAVHAFEFVSFLRHGITSNDPVYIPIPHV